MPTVLEGKSVSSALSQKLKNLVDRQRASHPLQTAPKLTILQVGDNPASKAYISRKLKVAAEIGILTEHLTLACDASEAEIEKHVVRVGNDKSVHGMIIQLPLDQKIKSSEMWVNALLEKIPPTKDADGLATSNLGKIFAGESTAARWTAPIPATALGVMRLLEHYKISVRGKTCLVIGKSRLVGNPTAQLLLQAGATVSIVHSQSPDWTLLAQNADLIVVAAGVKHLLKAKHLGEKTVVIDVGIHKTEMGLTGDADPEACAKSIAYSPVPGGVGQMTVACLMENLVELWLRHF
ncbi:MAG: bifunctional 5,10-methylenetetrahydrofolate dehydrogenase/5,10-methenyltetrahydrofolate cyclohydrolase [Bdellovibrionota bacterium]